MLTIKDGYGVYVAAHPVDMRKSIDGLTAEVVNLFERDPREQFVFVFRNRSADKVKILLWDRNGFVIHYKRLERGRFRFPKGLDPEDYTITLEQLNWLLAGLDFHTMSLYPELNFSNYF